MSRKLIPKLRGYQSDLVQLTRSLLAINNKEHILTQLGTGGGKTYIFSFIAAMATAKVKKVMVVSNRSELMNQAASSFAEFGVEVEYISPKQKEVPKALAVSAMAQTLRRRIKKPEWIEYIRSVDIIIIDEAHLQDADYLFDSGLLSDKCVLGYTATPIRGGKQKQLGLQYAHMIQGISTTDLIGKGNLVMDRYFSFDSVDTSSFGFDPKTGDYKSSDMAGVFDSPKKYAGVVKNWQKLTPDTKTLIFCCNQVHAVKTALEFEKAGVKVKFLTSGIKKPVLKEGDSVSKFKEATEIWKLLDDNKRLTGKRDDVISEFKNNEFLVLVNVSMLTTGFDVPDIETIVLNRSTISLSLYLQMIGRGSRPFPGKILFNVLDFGDNADRLGRYADHRIWSLWHEESKGGGDVMMKICPDYLKDRHGKFGCNKMIPATMLTCPFCDYSFKTEKELKEIELTEQAYKGLPPEEVHVGSMDAIQLVAYSKLMKYKMTWVFRRIWINSVDDKKEFKAQMRSIGYDWKFIYRLIGQYEK